MPHHGNEAEHNDPVTPEAEVPAEDSESGAAKAAPEGAAGAESDAEAAGQAEGDALDQARQRLRSALALADLDDEQAELLRRLAALRGEERPEAKVASAHPSVFSRLKDKLSGR